MQVPVRKEQLSQSRVTELRKAELCDGIQLGTRVVRDDVDLVRFEALPEPRADVHALALFLVRVGRVLDLQPFYVRVLRLARRRARGLYDRRVPRLQR